VGYFLFAMLEVVILSVVMLNIVMLSAIMLSLACAECVIFDLHAECRNCSMSFMLSVVG
jgi:hypothetical protein